MASEPLDNKWDLVKKKKVCNGLVVCIFAVFWWCGHVKKSDADNRKESNNSFHVSFKMKTCTVATARGYPLVRNG